MVDYVPTFLRKNKTKKIKIKPSKLENQVVMVKPKRDENGRYIEYCDFGFHQGVLVDGCDCDFNGCKHYRKMYL